MALRVFYSSVSSSLEIKKGQQRIFDVLTAQNIEFLAVDIAQNVEDKNLMREIAGDPKALPPQICKGNTYCGDYAAFDRAVEGESLQTFLKL